jgi:hypothetical protein
VSKLPSIDIRRVQAALDRAAWQAVHGPKEARAGRYTTGSDCEIDAKQATSLAKSDMAKK